MKFNLGHINRFMGILYRPALVEIFHNTSINLVEFPWHSTVLSGFWSVLGDLLYLISLFFRWMNVGFVA